MPKPEMPKSAVAIAMRTLGIERIERIEVLQEQGWFTSKEFAQQAGIDRQTAKAMLDKSDKFERCAASSGAHRVTAYRLKPR